MPIKCFDARQEFSVVAAGDQNLGVRAHGGLEYRERAGSELVLFELGDLEFSGERESALLGVKHSMLT